MLPADLAYTEEGKRGEAMVGSLPGDKMLVDIGAKTAAAYREAILGAKTVFVNGPMGIFEKEETEFGTRAVWQALADTEGYTVVGGGDSGTATNKYGLGPQMGYICTGGGALIR